MRHTTDLARTALALGFITAGAMHLIRPALYLPIMPPALPCKAELILASGLAEIGGGAGLLIPPLRRPAVYGLIALLIAVFPANIQMARNGITAKASPLALALLLARLPLQPALIWLVARER